MSSPTALLPDLGAAQKMRVHNSDLYVEYMQAADWSESTTKDKFGNNTTGSGSGARRPLASSPKKGPKSNKFGGSFGAPPGTNKSRNAPGASGTTEKQREAFMEKQVVREQQFRQKFEVARQQTERRAKEKADQKEKDFEARFLDFVTQNHTLVNEVDGAVRADEAWRTRKRERLFNEWTLKVFQPMQEEINTKIASMNSDVMESKRRQMFQSFLDESNRKTNGLFRDIIIESDYDPVSQAKQATMSYNRAKIMDDPTKNRSTREEGDQLVKGLMEAHKAEKRASSHAEKQPRLFVSVEMWDRMESTPYGRYSNEKERKTKDNFMKSNVGFDHYTYKTGREAFENEKVIRGKAQGPSDNHAKESTVKECFTLPTRPAHQPMGDARGSLPPLPPFPQ